MAKRKGDKNKKWATETDRYISSGNSNRPLSSPHHTSRTIAVLFTDIASIFRTISDHWRILITPSENRTTRITAIWILTPGIFGNGMIYELTNNMSDMGTIWMTSSRGIYQLYRKRNAKFSFLYSVPFYDLSLEKHDDQ